MTTPPPPSPLPHVGEDVSAAVRQSGGALPLIAATALRKLGKDALMGATEQTAQQPTQPTPIVPKMNKGAVKAEASRHRRNNNMLGILILVLIYILVWQRALGSATSTANGLPDKLAHATPGSAFMAMFAHMFVELLVIIIIIAVPLYLWQFVVVSDVARMIGLDTTMSSLAVALGDAMRGDVLMLLLLSSAVTMVYTYFSTFALHARRAPPDAYLRLIESTFQFNLVLVMGTLAVYATVSA